MNVGFDLSEVTAAICRKPRFGWKFIGLDEVNSTNTYAKEKNSEIFGPTIVVAKHQTAGRGRGTNTWVDDGGGSAFLSTWIMELENNPPDPRWTLGIGLFLYEALGEAFPQLRTKLCMKAPNDICLGDRKVAGIMVESFSEEDFHFLHLGVGINVFSFPMDYTTTATCLNAFLGESLLTSEQWGFFIESFGTAILHLENRVKNDTGAWLKRISPRLCEALNKHPLYSANPIKSVDEKGNLIQESGKIPWQSL